MRIGDRIRCALVGVAAVAGTAGFAASTPADLEALRHYVEANRAYSADQKRQALEELGRATELVGTDAKFQLLAARIAALTDNGHSFLLPGQWTLHYPRSPVHFGLFADGLRVIKAPPEHSGLIGGRVVAINGVPWQRIRQAYGRYQGGRAGFKDQFVHLFMETPALLSAAGFGSDDRRMTMTIVPPGRARRTISIDATLAPLQGEEAYFGSNPLLEADAQRSASGYVRPLYLQEPGRTFRRGTIAGANAYYIQMKATRDGPGQPIADFLAATEAELRTVRPENVIVDLRFNMGGDLNTARNFMQALPGLVRGGRIYAITSGRTFSAAISSLGYLKQAAGDRLTIVGEPAGDRLEFWAEGDTVELPGVGAILLYATERHNYMTGCPEPDCHGSIRNHPIRVRSLEPDIRTSLSYRDFLAGRDPAMAAIIREIGKRQRS